MKHAIEHGFAESCAEKVVAGDHRRVSVGHVENGFAQRCRVLGRPAEFVTHGLRRFAGEKCAQQKHGMVRWPLSQSEEMVVHGQFAQEMLNAFWSNVERLKLVVRFDIDYCGDVAGKKDGVPEFTTWIVCRPLGDGRAHCEINEEPKGD